MQIDWWTLVLQGVNFLVLVWLLQRFLYKPVTEVIAKRRQLAEQAFGEAEATKTEAEAERSRFEGERAQLDTQRRELLEKAHADVEAERAKIMEQAKHDANALMESTRGAMEHEREAALSETREQVLDLAVELASRLLRGMQSATLDDVFLRHLEKQLGALPAEELERLRGDLTGAEGGLAVVTAGALAAETQSHWREHLEALLGQGRSMEFLTDPDIIGGVELRFPHSVLKLTWADQLKQAKSALCEEDTPSRQERNRG